MKNIPKAVWWIIGIVIVIGALLAWSRSLANGNPNVISQGGLHWHAQLTMYVKGEKVEIPKNIGIGAVHQPMHTHEDVPTIHMEFQGAVRKQDMKLGNFFRNWGKDMRSFGSSMRMTVNGAESTEYEDYVMRDGDVIELRYE